MNTYGSETRAACYHFDERFWHYTDDFCCERMALRDLFSATIDVKQASQAQNPNEVVSSVRKQIHAHTVFRTFNGTTTPTKWTETVTCPFQAKYCTVKRLGVTGAIATGAARLLVSNIHREFRIPIMEGQPITDPNITFCIDNLQTSYDFQLESSINNIAALSTIQAGTLTVMLEFASHI